jgi:hypothetical protein
MRSAGESQRRPSRRGDAVRPLFSPDSRSPGGQIDEETALARLGQAGGEVDGRRRLADAALLVCDRVDAGGHSSQASRGGGRAPVRRPRLRLSGDGRPAPSGARETPAGQARACAAEHPAGPSPSWPRACLATSATCPAVLGPTQRFCPRARAEGTTGCGRAAGLRTAPGTSRRLLQPVPDHAGLGARPALEEVTLTRLSSVTSWR